MKAAGVCTRQAAHLQIEQHAAPAAHLAPVFPQVHPIPDLPNTQPPTVLVKLPQPCWLKVSTTISPRRFRSSGSPSARSAAELAARGYSPPTPVRRAGLHISLSECFAQQAPVPVANNQLPSGNFRHQAAVAMRNPNLSPTA